MFQKSFIALAMAVCLCVSSLAWADNVYVTKKGKKYHKAACELIKKSQLSEIDQAQAEEKGYKPCGRCFKENQTQEQK